MLLKEEKTLVVNKKILKYFAELAEPPTKMAKKCLCIFLHFRTFRALLFFVRTTYIFLANTGFALPYPQLGL